MIDSRKNLTLRNSPRNFFERFNIEVLSTTDAASDTLNQHKEIKTSEWNKRLFLALYQMQ